MRVSIVVPPIALGGLLLSLSLLAVGLGSCSKEPTDPPRGIEGKAALGGDVVATGAPAYVDPHIATVFSSQPRARVFVQVADPRADHRDHAGKGFRGSPGRAKDVAAREADLLARKDRVLKAFEKDAGHRARVIYRYDHFALMTLDLDATEVGILANVPEVVSLLGDRDHEAASTTSVPFTDAPVQFNDGYTGQNTAVAVLDLAVNYWNGDFGTCPTEGNWVDDTSGCRIVAWRNYNQYPASPDDAPEDDPIQIAKDNTHGRNVTGIVGAEAPGTQLLAFNVFRYHNGQNRHLARRSDVIAALNDIVNFQNSYNVVAANMSLGSERLDARPCNSSTNEYYDPIRSLYVDRDVLVSISSGNDGHDNWIGSPGCITPALTTAAQFDTAGLGDYTGSCTQMGPMPGEIVCFSNLNGQVDYVAPGVRIQAGGVTKSGTSMAAPHVAGAVAVMQSWHMGTYSTYAAPARLNRLMRIQADTREHNGNRYMQLDLSGGPKFQLFGAFNAWLREETQAEIPLAPNELTETLTISGENFNIAGLYLHVEVIHPRPEDVDLTLTSPSNTAVTITLPSGQSNFNAVIGRDVAAGIFGTMAGEPVDGTWTLSFKDTSDAPRGHYVSATAYWVQQGCVPVCGQCGDDQCGGSCGTCGVNEVCDAQAGDSQVCVACTPNCNGVVCGTDRCGGSCGSCDDSVFCNGVESCTAGQCDQSSDACDVDDGLDCTNLCDETADACNYPDMGFCVIDGACVAEGAVKPGTKCEACNRAVDPFDWSISEGFICNDDDSCTALDACDLAGSCSGTAVDCSGLTRGCDIGRCDGGACVADAAPDGSACDDADACTTNDSCRAGECSDGTPVNCPAETECSEAGMCDASGGCVVAAKADGTACAVGSCTAGACVPAPVVADSGCGCIVVGQPSSKRYGVGWLLLACLLIGGRRRAAVRQARARGRR